MLRLLRTENEAPSITKDASVATSTSTHATTSALFTGDSATRLTVLSQLKQTFDAQPTIAVDDQIAAWILPAIEQCKTDSDPEVVALAEQLASDIKDKNTQRPQ